MGKAGDTFKKIIEVLFIDKPDENDKYRKTGLASLYRKELADQIQSRRFLIVLLIIAITGLVSVYSAGQGIQSALKDTSAMSDHSTFLTLFSSSGGSLPSFVSFLSFLGPIVGLAMGFDAINGERSRRTLTRLLAQPIYRDSVINGKFLAGLTVISIMVFSLGLIFSSIGVIMIGVPPSVDDILRILIFLVYTIVYMALWLSVSILLSLVFRHATTSILLGISVWMFFTFFWGLISSGIASGIYKATETSPEQLVLSQNNLTLGLSRIAPSTLYTESISAVMNPSVRFLSPYTITSSQATQLQQSGLMGPLPLDQSLLLVWPHLVGLLAITLVCFAISYVIFMRQEVRAGS